MTVRPLDTADPLCTVLSYQAVRSPVPLTRVTSGRTVVLPPLGTAAAGPTLHGVTLR